VTGVQTCALPYDVFGYLSGGALAVEKLAWTSATARATGISVQDGRYCKTGDKTRLYLGSFCSTSTTTTEDSATKRLLWNMYNRVTRVLLRKDTTASWAYTTATARPLNNSSANRVEVLCGLAGLSCVRLDGTVLTSNSSADVGRQMLIGRDSTTAAASNCIVASGSAAAAGALLMLRASIDEPAELGYHYYQALERSVASGTCTWYGATVGIGDYTGLSGGIEA
jgi:hypothetical protein